MAEIVDQSLIDLAARRANTPPVLPGAPINERLVASRDKVRTILLQYTDQIGQYDPQTARTAVDEIVAWANSNSNELVRAFRSEQTELPSALALTMGSDRARAFVLSLYMNAAVGISVHTSGAAEQSVIRGDIINGVLVTAKLVRDDAQARLDAFGVILRMEESGALRQLFVPPSQTSGLGAGPLGALPAWAIVFIVLGVAAALTWGATKWNETNKTAPIIAGLAERSSNPGQLAYDLACAQNAWCEFARSAGKPAGEGVMWFGAIAGLGLAGYFLIKALSARRPEPRYRRLRANRTHRRMR